MSATHPIDDEQATVNEPDRVKKVLDIQRYYMENMFYIPVAVGYEIGKCDPASRVENLLTYSHLVEHVGPH